MASIFISYTSRSSDPERYPQGEGWYWAQQIAGWLREWGYEDLFLDKDPERGLQPASDWRRDLLSKLRRCEAVIAFCSAQYAASAWCMAEVGIAIAREALVIPIHLGESYLPLLLQDRQAIALDPAAVAGAKGRLKAVLDEKITWREKLVWEEMDRPLEGKRRRHRSPFPGLEAYEAHHAPVFFGREQAINRVEARLRERRTLGSGLVVVLGSSGCGKSSLLKAGVVPLLRQQQASGEPWLLLEPIRPFNRPFTELNNALRAAGAEPLPNEPSARQLLERLDALRQEQSMATALLVIDQFEELFTYQADAFLALLRELLGIDHGQVLVLASLRTDFLAQLENHPSGLMRDGRGQQELLNPITGKGIEELITKPLHKLGRDIEAELLQKLLGQCGDGEGNQLPLLSYTLEKLWDKQEERWAKAAPDAPLWRQLLLVDYEALGGLEKSVALEADRFWSQDNCEEEERLAVRQAFLRHLVRLSEGDKETRRQALRSELPPRSLAALDKLVEARLLVTNQITNPLTKEKQATLEIAHESLLSSWPTLKTWIEEGREELLQRRRVKRLTEDLAGVGAEKRPLRRTALEQLAALAAQDRGTGDHLAVRQEGTEPLARLLASQAAEEAERLDAALILALIGAEPPLLACLADGAAPVGVRRRAAESLGLLAKRSGDPEQRGRIERELEAVLRGEPLDVQVAGAAGWKEHDERLPLLQGAARGLQLAASADLPLLGSGPGQVVPMLTLTALEEGGGLQITTEVVEVKVWQLPLPGGEQLELVAIPGGEHRIGSPADERDKQLVLDWFADNRDGCRDPQTRKPLDVEARRTVQLAPCWLVRHPISQGQWKAVVEGVEAVQRELEPSPGKANPDSLWERHGQPGQLAVDSVSWHDCQEWLRRLNRWLGQEWAALGGQGAAPQLALPGEGQWEAACRAGAATPFHFGDTLDAHWARYNASVVFGPGRKGPKLRQPGVNGACGLVNRYGLAEMHGQLFEWCEDSWHPNPVGQGWPADGQPWRGEDRDLARRESGQRGWKLLRGGSWFINPHYCRAADRISNFPDGGGTIVGLRPCCCPSPPGSLLGS